jgi:spermidine/putrescine transport system ATP-binding protein
MQLELKRIQRETGVTFVFVTHDQEEALTMSDRVAVMSDGWVEQIGTPEEVYHRPQTAFVAGFIGEANLLAGLADEVGRVLMVRPERVRIVSTAPPSPSTAVEGTVSEVVFRGATTRLALETAAGTVVAHLGDDRSVDVRPGDRAWATWNDDDAYLVPAPRPSTIPGAAIPTPTGGP